MSTTRTTSTTVREALVIDSFDFLWPNYRDAIPRRIELTTVADIVSAEQHINTHGVPPVIIIQGISKLDAKQFGEDPCYTRNFIGRLIDRGYRGHIFVVSQSLTYEEAFSVKAKAPGQVHVHKKDHFLACASRYLADKLFIPPTAIDELWRLWLEDGAQDAGDMIEWLLDFIITINTGDDETIFHSLIMMAPYRASTCECELKFPSEAFAHAHHGLYNQAVWWTLGTKRNLVSRLNKVLDAELDNIGINPEYPDFGRFVRRDYGLELRSFLSSKGTDPSWFDKP